MKNTYALWRRLCSLLLFGSIVIGQPPPLYAQNTNNYNQHLFQVGIGQQFSPLRDWNFSPLDYNNQGRILDFMYTRIFEKGEFTVWANYTTGNAKTKSFTVYNSEFTMGNLRLKYLKQAGSTVDARFPLYLGGQFHSHIYYIDWEDQEAFSFLGNHSIDFSAKTYYQINGKSRLIASLDLPLLSLTVRPPYNSWDEELNDNNDNNPFALITNGQWGSFNQIFSYNLRIEYAFQLNNNFELVASYNNHYHRVYLVDNFTHFQNQLIIGLKIKL